MEDGAVRKAWEKFVERGTQSPGLKDSVSTSWMRCRNHEVLVSRPHAPIISEAETYRHRSDNLWLASCAAPALERCGTFLGDANSMMILTDTAGVIIETRGDNRSIDQGKEIHLQRGGCWNESDIGTNAIGTALAAKCPVQIHASEHYCERVQKWTCAAAPIFHPVDRELLGVIDLSGPASNFSSQSLALAVAAADNIQAVMAKSIRIEHWKLMRHFRGRRRNWTNDESIVVDRRGTIVCVTSHALKIANSQNEIAINNSHLPSLRSVPFSRWEGALKLLLPHARTELVTEGESELGAIIVFPQKNNASEARASVDHRRQGIDIDEFIESLLAKDFDKEPVHLHNSKRSANTDKVIRTGNVGAQKKSAISPQHHKSEPTLISDDPRVHQIVEQVSRAVNMNMPILIGGATGTGKELLARHAHAKSGRSGPFIPVNCAALPANLIEAELFGYADGAFTGARRGGSVGLAAQADGGTLFLDEIGDMPITLQTVLLRLLDDWTVRPVGGSPRKVDVQLVSATNIDFETAVAEGRLRGDLFFRLNTLQVVLPLLSQRTDFAAMATHLLSTLDEKCVISEEALELLSKRPWPGNMRELRSVLARLLLNLKEGNRVIEASHVTNMFGHQALDSNSKPDAPGGLRDLRRAHVAAVYEATNHNIAETARRLGVSRNTVYRDLGLSKKFK